MNNDFADKINEMEREILALKTVQSYANTSTAGLYQSQNNPAAGTYLVTYGSGDSNILSVITWDGVMAAFTPSGNTQQLVLTNVRSFRITSNRRILSVVKTD